MNNVLVTGGAVCKALAAAGCRPIAFDNLSSGHVGAVKWAHSSGGYPRSRPLEKVLRAYKPVVTMHFAAFAYVGESLERRDKYYGNNVVGTLTPLDGMRTCGGYRFFKLVRHVRHPGNDSDCGRKQAIANQSVWAQQAHDGAGPEGLWIILRT
jgi:nucleoside-diphosphate-sugar epimerase